MAILINTNKPKFINDNIEYFNQTKLGQYSKFLPGNPMYVTYLSFNKTQTRTDVGLGGVEEEWGPNSPIKLNKILNLPVFNIPELKPDVNFDETGMEATLDLPDITILPNTIKPTPGEWIIIEMPGVKKMVFRVTNYRHNTIQSNDFYIIDLELKFYGDGCDSRFNSQIIDVYETIFDKIGTEQSCFVLSQDVEKINELVRILNQIKDFYINAFYDNQTNSFVCYVNSFYNRAKQLVMIDPWLYDPYISEFINKSNIYYEENQEKSLVLTRNDILPMNFDYLFTRTFPYAILQRDMRYMNKFNYYYQVPVSKPLSPFKRLRLDVNTITLFLSDVDINEWIEETKIFNDMRVSPVVDAWMKKMSGDIQVAYPITAFNIQEHYSMKLIYSIFAKKLESDDYLDRIIFNYMNFFKEDIDIDELIKYSFDQSIRTYMYMPLIMYILEERYKEFFNIRQDL